MKKYIHKLSFLFFSIYFSSSFSQFKINSSYNPFIGDLTISRNMDINGIVQGQKFPVVVISYQNYYDSYSKNINFSTVNELIGIKQSSLTAPNRFCLYQNCTSTFNSSTNIRFQILKNCFEILKVNEILRIENATLVNEKFIAGKFEVLCSVNKDENKCLTSSIYLYKIGTYDYFYTNKMMLLKRTN
jgi:hypothetical protein